MAPIICFCSLLFLFRPHVTSFHLSPSKKNEEEVGRVGFCCHFALDVSCGSSTTSEPSSHANPGRPCFLGAFRRLVYLACGVILAAAFQGVFVTATFPFTLRRDSRWRKNGGKNKRLRRMRLRCLCFSKLLARAHRCAPTPMAMTACCCKCSMGNSWR